MKKFILFIFSLAVFVGCSHHKGANEDRFVTPSGDILYITPIKHASLQMEYKDKIYQIDPVCSNVEPIVEYVDKPKADYIIVTDFHDDHFDSYAIHVLNDPDKTNILLNNRSWIRLKKKGVVMRNWQKATLDDGVSILAVPAYNTTKDYQKIHPKDSTNGYIFNFDGFRVYIAGDTEPIPEMKKFGKIDVAFLPCNRPFTMRLSQVVEAANILRPKVLYPYNWNETSEESIRKATKDLKMDVRIRYFK